MVKALFNLKPGVAVETGGERYVITHIMSIELVLAKSHETGKSKQLRIQDLTPWSDSAHSESIELTDLSSISQEDWQKAQERFNIILPLLSASRRTRQMVDEVARANNVHATTVYRWIDLYEQSGRVSVFVPSKRDGGEGASRLQPEVEVILNDTIRDVYLNNHKRSTRKTCEEVERRCLNAKLPPPHPNTVRNRIGAISEKEKDRHRLGLQKAEKKHSPFPGHFPGADWPLAVIQIDHTLLDVVLVDDIYRLPIGRPWITLAIDVYSRMVAGFYISLDPPGSMSVGLCLAHSILPKEKWLTKYEITTPWPCWGVMAKIHADNAGEFRGNMLKRACKEYGIDLEWRPVKKPHYGAHIERLLGTFLTEIHDLPGTTFSNPEERGEYDSEQNAAMTLFELENWLITFITGDYHQRVHSALLTSPINQYEIGILGNKDMPGRGLPIRITDEDRLWLDLMPYIERTVQEYGVVIDEIHYYSDILRRYVNAKDPANAKRKLKFPFRRDPRDISVIYFYDPEVKQYFTIPYRDISHPPISIWEYRKILKYLKKQGIENINERLIFETREKMQAQVEQSKRETKRVRREHQRRRNNQRISKPKTASDKQLTEPMLEGDSSASPTKIMPFDETEFL